MIILTTLAVAVIAVYVGKVLLTSNQHQEMRPIRIKSDNNRSAQHKHRR